jgi:hypothetical protein
MAQGGAPQDLEMGNIRTPDRVTSPTTGANGNGYSGGNGTDAMTAFYSEVRPGSTLYLRSRDDHLLVSFACTFHR